MESYRNSPTYAPDSLADWRRWLEANHATKTSLWLIAYKKDSGHPYIPMGDLVDEALCFGWVDSSINKRDGISSYRYFTPRKENSNWSRINKKKVERLILEGRMAPAGLEMVALAKKTGTWTALDDVENLVIPPDMLEEFSKYGQAREHWDAFPRSVKRGILEWIFNAKRPETRAKRIRETVSKAEENIRANQYTPK